MYHITAIALFAALASACPAPQPPAQQPYAQCGGINFNGGTTCTTGWTCIYSNPWYSQCLPTPCSAVATLQPSTSSASPSTPTNTPPNTPTDTPTDTPTNTPTNTPTDTPTDTPTNTPPNTPTDTPTGTPTNTPTKAATPSTSTAPAAASSAPPSSGVTYKSSVTQYGAGDSFGSPNCQTNTAACGFFTSPGFSAAVSQNLYGAAPGAGAGPACGTCWKIVGETDSSGNPLSNAGTSIVVMVNNLCPAQGNPLCAQNGLTDTNQYGANVNFDLCSDSGAAAAFFGNSGVGLAVGTATEVPCSEYSGTIVH